MLSSLTAKAKLRIRQYLTHQLAPKGSGEAKVFCIGLNKTGTTSLEKALEEMGHRFGDQTAGELLLNKWAKRNFQPIIDFCHSADAFQDVPFSLPYTYQALDQAFPNAKFILTVRDSAEAWYESMTRFHSKLWADGERIPTPDDLKNAFYLEAGYIWRGHRLIYNTPDTDPYHKSIMLAHYDRHLASVRDYFRHRSDKLIEVNIARDGEYLRLCRFLGKEPLGDSFPWLNKT